MGEILQACPTFDSKTSVCGIFFPINPSQSCQNSKKGGHLGIYEVLERHRANLTGGGPKNPGERGGATLDVKIASKTVIEPRKMVVSWACADTMHILDEFLDNLTMTSPWE